jgi:uncharacterized protein
MSAAENKALLQGIYAALEDGDTKPFTDAMADDFAWITPGEHAWSGIWRGKEAVGRELHRPLFAQFANRYTSKVTRIIAEGDTVVVECRGRVKVKSGADYNNSYCMIFRVEDGKLKELTEYMDSALAERVLIPPKR